MANVRIIDQAEITTLSGGEYLVTDSSTAGTKKITPQNLVNACSTGSGLTNEIKTALLDCFEHVAWIDDDGQDYYDALEAALYDTAWPVTNTLTHCSSSNNATSVEKDGSYSATITAESGYTLTGATVSITMGGTDITSTAYSSGTISIASVTGALVISVTAVINIPADYQAVEYLQSTGDEYIDTGLTGDLDTEVEIKLLRITAASTTARVFGDRTAANNKAVFMSTLNSGIYVGFGSHDTNSSAAGNNHWDLTNPQTIIWNKTDYSINGTTKNYNNGSTPSTFTTPNTMTVFNARQAGSYGTGVSAKLYYLIIRENGTAVFNGIPCYRKADDEPGLYDTVTSTFFANSSGSGAFTVGGDV